ncbi:3-oxo-5alpha-steroid 4-dehydrogenase (NADP+) [Chytriomyces confervae]|uniref:3-oxo-5alpha-steroid 4-dehydrogenase (NADP+) n=1 Tax=Chytriomyces confervae TaxID=246404 RepID=A0A507EVF3_9FUNG|nr:3-oxo-5alpha-steroid 4-dehydrogenase (NADP+) [Chytriomyces confervae]
METPSSRTSVFDGAILFIWAYGLAAFAILMLIPAPYGKFHRTGFGTRIDGKTGWLVMESVAWIVFALCATTRSNPASQCLWLLWMTHYIHRSIVYTLAAPSMSPTTAVNVVAAIIFNTANAFVNAAAVTAIPSNSLETVRFWIGVAVFACGMGINVVSDRTLFSLRKGASTNDGRKRYSIPRGFLFEYVSAANYFGEIVEWIGWAIACNNIAGLSFALFTMANLVPRALSTHKWYRERFGNVYPSNRKAVIPFLL